MEKEEEPISRKVFEAVKRLAGTGAIGLLAAGLGFVGVVVFDSYNRVLDHDSQFRRVWTPELHRQLTDDLDEIETYIASHEAYRALYAAQDSEFRATVNATLATRDRECRDNWAEINKRVRQIEQLAAVLQSRIERLDQPWSLSK